MAARRLALNIAALFVAMTAIIFQMGLAHVKTAYGFETNVHQAWHSI